MNIKKLKYKKDFTIYYNAEKPSQVLIDKAIFYLKNYHNGNSSELVKKIMGEKFLKLLLLQKAIILKNIVIEVLIKK